MTHRPTPEIALPADAPPQAPVEPEAATDPEVVTAPEPATADHYPSRRTLARWALVALALYAVGWLLWNARQAMLPFVVGLVLAYLLLPLVNRFNRYMRRPFAILTVYVAGLILIAALVDSIVPPLISQVDQLIESLPSIDELQVLSNNLLRQYQNRVSPSVQQAIDQGARNTLRAAQANLTTYVQSAGSFVLRQVLQVFETVTFLVGFLIVPFWLFYILHDEARGRAFIDRILHPRIRADFWNVWGIINHVLSDYIRGQLILGVTVGVMVAVGLLILQLLGFRMQYILLLSIVAGFTELIPIVGPILGAIPGVVIGLFISPATGLAALVIYIVVQQIENNFLVPRIVGESIGIHPAVLTVILIAMGQVFGLLGVFLAAPLAAIARDLFVYTYQRIDGSAPEAARLAVTRQHPATPRAAARP